MKSSKPLAEAQNRCVYTATHVSLLILVLFIRFSLFAQKDSLAGFDREGATKHSSYAKSEAERVRVFKASEHQFIKNRFFSHKDIDAPRSDATSQRSSANCDNLGFESNSLSGWVATGDYQIVSGGKDHFGNFPKVFPGGKYSLQLNNNTIINKNNFKASATKLFTVSSGNSFINLHFAMVILNFPHDSADAARFTIKLRDSTSHVTLCPRFSCYYEIAKGAVGANNFSVSAVKGINTGNMEYDVTCAAWQTIGIDLSAYMGRKIALQISCDWCIYDVDWAYCYIDADCDNFLPAFLPCLKMPAVLSGPPGFQNYKWYAPGGSVLGGNSSTVSIQSDGTYTLHCNQTPGCSDLPFIYAYTVWGLKPPTIRVESVRCNLSVKFTALDTIPGFSYKWKWQDSVPGNGPSVVRHIFPAPGFFWLDVEATDQFGCKSVSRVTLTLTAPVDVRAATTDPPGTLYGPDDKKNYVAFSGYSFGNLNYTWTGENFNEQGSHTRIGEDGLYIVKAIDTITGCSDTAQINVILYGWVPNIFTPNNDGVNDLFRFRTKKGMVLEVYDRWENKVNEFADVKGIVSWDGKTKDGMDCSEGAFAYFLRPNSKNPQERRVAGLVMLAR